MKKCTKCDLVKPFDQFSKRAKAADGMTHYCKVCLAEGNRKWQQANKDRVEEYRKVYTEQNKTKIREYRQRYQIEKKDQLKKAKAERYLRTRERCISKVKERYEKNRDEILAYGARYREENREKLRAHQKEYIKNNWDSKKEYMSRYFKERKANDPVFAMTLRLRSRMGIFFRKKGFTKPDTTYKLIGCSYVELAAHIESKFTDGMNWDNRSEWHIDHKIPLSSAKTIDEVIPLFHYSNLQPLWAIDNMLKGSRMPEDDA